MKFFRLLLIPVIISYFFASEAKCQVLFGVKGGINLTKGKFESGNTDYLVKYHIGILTEFSLNEKSYIMTELLFSQKGWKLPNDAINNNVSITLSYLNSPVLIGLKLYDNISIFAGPELGFKLKEQRKPSGTWTENYEKFDIGLTFGTNYKISSKFGIDLRYTYGFKGLINDDVLFTDEFGNVTKKKIRDGSNRAILIGIFYTFN